MSNNNKYPIITISREYASYGNTIASKISERLGIPYYNKDFVRKTVAESNYSEEDVIREGESMSRGSQLLNTFLNGATGSYSSSYDGIHYAEKMVVLELSESPCIIVGRCANSILREAGVKSFDVFLYANKEFRCKRAIELEPEQESKIEKYVSKRDIMRETYHKQYTGHDLGDSRYYNLCLDVATIGIDRCVDIICNIVEEDAKKA